MRPPPNFDPVARPYRWLEWLTLGRALERCRERFLPQLAGCRRALVLGDGDGRFLARLFGRNRQLRASAVDTSEAMLELLEARCAGDRDRLTTHRADALRFLPAEPVDLICTHFFLDCFSQAEVDALAARLASGLAQPGALWVVSDFRIPATGPLRLPAKLLVRALYLAFRVLTGLRTTRLPDHASALRRAGFTQIEGRLSLCGILTAELWRWGPPDGRVR